MLSEENYQYNWDDKQDRRGQLSRPESRLVVVSMELSYQTHGKRQVKNANQDSGITLCATVHLSRRED